MSTTTGKIRCTRCNTTGKVYHRKDPAKFPMEYRCGSCGKEFNDVTTVLDRARNQLYLQGLGSASSRRCCIEIVENALSEFSNQSKEFHYHCYEMLGVANDKLGYKRSAIYYWTKIIEGEFWDWQIHHALLCRAKTHSHYSVKNYKAALEDLSRIIDSTQSENWLRILTQALTMRGTILVVKGQLLAAKEDCLRAIALNDEKWLDDSGNCELLEHIDTRLRNEIPSLPRHGRYAYIIRNNAPPEINNVRPTF